MQNQTYVHVSQAEWKQLGMQYIPQLELNKPCQVFHRIQVEKVDALGESGSYGMKQGKYLGHTQGAAPNEAFSMKINHDTSRSPSAEKGIAGRTT